MNEAPVVKVTIDLGAPSEDVSPYFTDPGRHIKWMGTKADLSAVSGGVYRVTRGDGFIGEGVYREVRPPRLIAFTWGWAHERAVQSGDGRSSLAADVLPAGRTSVVVAFEDDEAGCRVCCGTTTSRPTSSLRATALPGRHTSIDSAR